MPKSLYVSRPPSPSGSVQPLFRVGELVSIDLKPGTDSDVLLALRYGLGQHVWDLPGSEVRNDISNLIQVFKPNSLHITYHMLTSEQLMMVDHIFGSCAITFTKVSIVASYLHIFPYRSLRIVMYTTAAVTVALFVASIFATVFQCTPVAAAGDFTITDAKCYKLVNYLYDSTAVNIVTDLVLCIAPLPCLCNLQLPRREVEPHVNVFHSLFVSLAQRSE